MSSTGVVALAAVGMCCVVAAVAGVVVYVNRESGTNTAAHLTPDAAPVPDTAVKPGVLPAPSRHDDRCVTYMGNSKDNGSCMALVYNHCIPGYTDQSRIPADIRSSKSSMLKAMYGVQRGQYDAVPADWTTVCVARPDKAGKGSCAGVGPGEIRVWTKGRPKAGVPDCDFSQKVVYVKAHFAADRSIQDTKTGTVGNG